MFPSTNVSFNFLLNINVLPFSSFVSKSNILFEILCTSSFDPCINHTEKYGILYKRNLEEKSLPYFKLMEIEYEDLLS